MFNFIYPYIPAYADTGSDNIQEAPGGVLLEPLLGLISSIGEGVIWVIQSQLLGMNTSNIHVTNDGNFWSNALKTAGTVVAGVAVGALLFVPGVNVAVVGAIGLGAATVAIAGNISEKNFPDDFYLPIYKISPQEIFSDQIPILHINFLNPKDYDEENDGSSGILPVYNSAKVLGPQVAKWYVAIRNFVLVGLMVVLLYIGIRIVISSTAGEKAKYKEHIKDWLVAVILVVFMHYIMAFALTLTEYLTNILNTQNESIAVKIPEESIGDVADALGDDADKYKSSDGNYYYYTNLMGYARLQQQMLSRDNNGNVQFSWNYIGYTIIYLVLVIYTVMFLVIYLKRVIYMAFLTMIAPLVALTYPIDKLSDGKAQAFDMWLKEYVYNLLLQPFHLLLYTLLVGSVMDLAMNNMLYAIVALGFLMPAENLLRKFFGFQKAPETGSIVGGVVGGTMAMNAINSIKRLGTVGQRGKGGKATSSGDGEKDNGKTRLTDRRPDSDKKISVEDLLMKENPEEGDSTTSSSTSTTPMTDSNVAVRTTMPPNINPNVVSAGNDAIVDTHDNLENAPEPFDPYSDYETINSDDFRNNLQAKKEWLGNLPPIRGVNNTIGAIKNGFQGWIKETPKTARGRDAKRMVIRGGKTLKAGAGTALHFTGKGLKTVAQKAPRLIAKGALGAAVGTAGIAAGISTGDWSNIAAYGVTAASVGASVGDGVSNVAGNIGKGTQNISKEIREDFESRAHPKDVRMARKNAKADEEWKNDKDVIRNYKDEFGKDYKKAMNTALKFREYGITNDKAIMKKVKDIGIDATPTGRDIAITKAAASVQNEEQLKGLSERLRKNGIKEKEITKLENDVRKMNVSGEFV